VRAGNFFANPPGTETPRGARVLAWLVALGALGLLVSPLWRDVSSWAIWGDCKYFWFVIEVDRVSILQHHQFPLWNPYYGGGAPHFANPQASSLSPLTALVLLFGTPIGYRLGYTLGLLTALISLRAYARTLGISPVAATLAGAGYAVCGAFAQHMGGGHWSWLGFALHPLLLRSFHLARDGRLSHVTWGALVFMLIVFHSPIYPMAFAFVSVSAYALFVGAWAPVAEGKGAREIPGSAVRSVGWAWAILFLGVGLGALRLVPMGEFVAAHPRAVKDWDFTWPQELFTTYAVRWSQRAFGGHQYVFPEFGNYFGWIGIGLMFLGLGYILAKRRALVPVVAAAVLCVLFQLGNLIPLPWWLLKHLPVYKNLRVPSRFTILAGMFFCIMIATILDAWGTPALERGRRLGVGKRLLGVLVLAAGVAYLFDASSWNRLLFLPTLGLPAPTTPPSKEFHQVPGNAGFMMLYPRLNQGSLSYFEETPLDISPRLRPDLPADEYLADPDAGTLRRLSWSPNKIVLDLNLKRPTTVLVNQNWGVGWRAVGGEIVPKGEAGLLAARVAAGRHTLVLHYLPTSLIIGAGVSLLSLAMAIALIVQARTDRYAADS
jgi:hypothetical protein